MTPAWIVPVDPTAMVVPEYRACSYGRWRIRRAWHAADTGFWGDEGDPREVAFLEGPSADGTGIANWMSTVKSELDSQAIGICGAVGTTVVLGFGLGWAVANIALNPAVDRVIAVERDPEILGLAEISGVFAGLAPDIRSKIELREADAFSFVPDMPVDTLVADIWPDWLEDRVHRDTIAIQRRIAARRVHFWGQEMAIWRQAVRRFGPDAPFDWAAVRQVAEQDMDLPLILPDWPDYPEKILMGLRRSAYDEMAAVGSA